MTKHSVTVLSVQLLHDCCLLQWGARLAQSVWYLGYGLDFEEFWCDFLQWQEIFLFSKLFRAFLGPIQPSFQFTEVLSMG